MSKADICTTPIRSRRAVLAGIVASAALPIAGALPVAAAATPSTTDRRALEAYASWLFMERRILCGELWPHMGSEAERYAWFDNAGAGWHFRDRGGLAWNEGPQPSSRAAAVLDLAGVDWRQPKEDLGLNHADSGERPMLPDGWPRPDGELLGNPGKERSRTHRKGAVLRASRHWSARNHPIYR
jgi:hypothetical protein